MKHSVRRKQSRISIIVSVLAVAVATAAIYAVLSKNKETPKNEIEQIEVSEVIAIVNEDVGIEYPAGTVNYSDEFIKTLDEEEFAVTSATDAEEGLRDGSYAGTILFPANLSSDILNLNYANPQTIKLQYVISKEADKGLSDETHAKIIETYQDFNHKLSYAYLSAIMEEIETGQYSIKKIFENDASILEAAEKFSSGEYDSEYEEPDLPENEFEYKEQDVNEYKTSGMDYLHEVDRLYQEAYKKAHELGTTATGDVPAKEAFSDLADDMTNKFKEVKDYKEALEEFINDDENEPGTYKAYIKSVADYQAAVNDYKEAEEAHRTTEKTYRETYREKVNKYIDAVEQYMQIDSPTDNDKKRVKRIRDELTQEDLEDLEDELTKLTKEDENGKPILDANGKPKLTVWGKLDEAKKALDKIKIGNTPKLPDDKKFKGIGDLEDTSDDFQMALNTLYNAIDELTEGLKPENMLRATEKDAGSGKTYKDILDEKYKKFSSDVTDTTEKFNTIQTNNIEKLNNAYEKNSDYMGEKVESLNKKATKDQEKIGKAIEDFLKSAKAGSGDNKKRLETFRNMLSQAKVNGRISSELMQFLIRPIELEEYSKS